MHGHCHRAQAQPGDRVASTIRYSRRGTNCCGRPSCVVCFLHYTNLCHSGMALMNMSCGSRHVAFRMARSCSGPKCTEGSWIETHGPCNLRMIYGETIFCATDSVPCRIWEGFMEPCGYEQRRSVVFITMSSAFAFAVSLVGLSYTRWPHGIHSLASCMQRVQA